MRLKPDGMPEQHLRKKGQTLWESRIPDLDSLHKSHHQSVLVAIDTEMSSQTIKGSQKPCQVVSEVGIAILRLDGRITQRYEDIKHLHYEGGAEAFTVQIRERRKRPGERLTGQMIRSNPEEVTCIIESILSNYQGPRILVGFDLHSEFKWIVEDCPSVMPYFTAWLDVQEFALQRCKEFAAEGTKLQPRGLSTILKAMNTRDDRGERTSHYAVNDALRSLVVLCGLASDPSLLSDIFSNPPATRDSVQCYSKLKFKGCGATIHPFVARVSTVDGGNLPPWSPRAVSIHYAGYVDMMAVGLNWKKEKDRREGARFWNLSFRTAESLGKFITEINGSTVNETTKILVTRHQRVQDRLERQAETLLEESLADELDIS